MRFGRLGRVILLAAALVLPLTPVLASPAAAAQIADARVQGPRLLQDDRFPPRLDPRRHRRDPEARHGEQLRRRRHGEQRRVHRRQPRAVRGGRLPVDHRRPAEQRLRAGRPWRRYIQSGGGFAGIHSASDTHYNWEWYGKLVGGYFKSHPATQQATLQDRGPGPPVHGPPADDLDPGRRVVRLPDQPAQHGARAAVARRAVLPPAARWGSTTPSPGARTTTAAAPGTPASATPRRASSRPTSPRCCSAASARRRASRRPTARPRRARSFEKVTLDDNTSNPMMLDVAKDGRVFYIDRLGDFRIIKPSGATVTAARFNVFTASEAGLMGLVLDPNFDTNGWVYVYCSPAGRQRRPPEPVHGHRRHARPGQRGAGPQHPRPARRVLPPRRRPGDRPQDGRPLADHG